MPKEIRYLSRRRRNQIINRDFNSCGNNILFKSTLPNVASNIIEQAENINPNYDKISCTNSIKIKIIIRR